MSRSFSSSPPPSPLPLPLLQSHLPSQRPSRPQAQFPVRNRRSKSSVRDFSGRSKRSAISLPRRRRTRSITLSHSSLTTGRDFSMADLTIDLATLNVTNNRPNLYQQQEPDMESLGSEDDGPPDFTLNMEKWMRGTEKWKKEGGRIENDRDDEGHVSEGKESVGGESVEKKKDDVEEESDFSPLKASTPITYLASKENVPEPSHPSDTQKIAHRPSSRLNTEGIHTATSDAVSNQIRDLQVKIEQLQMEDGKHQLVKNSLQLENSTLRDEIDGLKDELSDVRSTISKMRQQVKVTDKERESERKSQEEAKSKVSSLQDKLEPVVQELAIARSTAEAEKRHSEAKIMVLEGKLLSTQETLMKQQIDSHFAQEIKNNENIRLKSELDICKGEVRAYQQTLHTREEDHRVAVGVLHKKLDAGHEAQSRADVMKMELDHTLEQLAESRRIVDTVEDENDRLLQENERQRDELNVTTTILTGKDASLAAAKSTIDELRDEIGRLKGEKNIGLIGEDVHDAEIKQLRQQHRSELQAAEDIYVQMHEDHNANISRLQDGTRRAATRAQNMLKDQIMSLKQEISTLKSRLRKATTDVPAATIAEYRNTLRKLSTKLNVANETILSTRHSLAEAHKSLAVSTGDVDRLRKKFDEFKPTIKKHYEDQLLQRELEWRKKMNAVLKDREVIAKQLFVMWSKEEMGNTAKGEKQLSAYESFKRNGEWILMAGDKGKDAEHILQPKGTDKKDQRTVQIAEKAKTGNQAPLPVATSATALQDAKNDALVRELTTKYQIEQRLQSTIENAKNDALVQKIIEDNQKPKPKQQAQAQSSSSSAAAAATAVAASTAPAASQDGIPFRDAKTITESLRRRIEEHRQSQENGTTPPTAPTLPNPTNDPEAAAAAQAKTASLRRRLEAMRDRDRERDRENANINDNDYDKNDPALLRLQAAAVAAGCPIPFPNGRRRKGTGGKSGQGITKQEKREKMRELLAKCDAVCAKYDAQRLLREREWEREREGEGVARG